MNAPQRLGPIRLATGVSRRHALCYLFAAFVSIALFSYMSTLTPYVFRVQLGVPEGEHGRLQGVVQFWQEIVLLAVIGLWGAWSDRVGRRTVYVLGFAIVAIGYAIYPLAESPRELIAYRLVFALGVAAMSAMLAALIGEYPEESSRGTFTGIAFFLNAAGAVLSFMLLTRLPATYAAQGASQIDAGRYTFFTIATIAAVGAIVMLGLKPARPAASAIAKNASLLRLVADGLRAGGNPRIALCYGSAFMSRADMSMITLFLTLWAVDAGVLAGRTEAEATARAGMVAGLAGLAALVWAPLFGYLGDRMNRVTLLAVAFAIAMAGYGWVGMRSEVLSLAAIPAILLLGAGQVSTIVASTLLLGQEAPRERLGSVFGVQGFFGGAGILVISLAGGWLYDRLGPNAPFIAVALANGMVLVAALFVRGRSQLASSHARG